MIRFFLFVLFILFVLSVNAQSVEETKDFIKLKCEQLKLSETYYNYNTNKICYTYWSFYFFMNFLVVNRQDQNSSQISCIDLKNIKAVEYDSNYSANESLVFSKYSNLYSSKKKQMLLYINHSIYVPHSLYKFNSDNDLWDFLLPKNPKKRFLPSNELSIKIGIENFTIENFIKFKKALKHLVKLNGGKIIDDDMF
jgi:hypothetical protein